MKIIDDDHVYSVTAGYPNEEDENKVFLSQDKTFDEADAIFTSLLGKKEYPVILLDEGDITIRGFIAPDKDEWDQRYTLLKEDLYKRTHPDKKPLYVMLAFKNYDPDLRHTYTGNKAYKLLESEDFNTAFSSYASYLDQFKDRKTPYNCVQLVDRNSRRIIEGNVFVPKRPETAIKSGKKHEEPGYDR